MSDLRTYAGPYNNRIDRVDAVSNQFRIMGVPDHIQKTNVFVQEKIVLRRKRVFNVAVDHTPGTRAGDFEGLANRHTYRYPQYPQLPAMPQAGALCTDPWVVGEGGAIRFRRWALNRSFDNVKWRAENGIDSYDSQVFDVTDLQPYLSHGLCTTDLARTDKTIEREDVWQGENDEKNDYEPPDMIAPITSTRRVVFGTWPENLHGDGYTLEEDMVEVEDEVVVIPGSVFSTKQTYALKFFGYTGDPNTSFQYRTAEHGDEYVILSALDGVGNAIDPFAQVQGAAAAPSTAFWAPVDGNGQLTEHAKFYRAADGTKTTMAGRRDNALYFKVHTSKIQLDGYCYFHQNEENLVTAGINPRKWVQCYTHLPGVPQGVSPYRPTNIGLALPAWRVATGNTFVDLNRPVPTIHTALNGIINDNAVAPGRDLGEGNVGTYTMHRTHLGDIGQSYVKEKIGEIYWDAAAWPDEPAVKDLLRGWDQINAMAEVQQYIVLETAHALLLGTTIPDAEQSVADVAAQLVLDLDEIVDAQLAYDTSLGDGSGAQVIADRLTDLEGTFEELETTQQVQLQEIATLEALFDDLEQNAAAQVELEKTVHVQTVLRQRSLPFTNNRRTNADLTKWRFEFADTAMGRYLRGFWKQQSARSVEQQENDNYWGTGAGVMTCVGTTKTLPQLFNAEIVVGDRVCSIDPTDLRSIEQYTPHVGEHGALYFQDSTNGFVFNRQPDDATIARFIANDAPHITSLDTLDINAGFAVAAMVQGPSATDRQVLQVTNIDTAHHPANTNVAKYKTMKFEVFAYQPRAVAPMVPVGVAHDLYEPFFSFGSGTGLFPCKRPLDQQNDLWPIAIQDYDIQFRRRVDRGLFVNPLQFEGALQATGIFNSWNYEDMVPAAQDLNTTVTKYQLGESNPTLVVNSSDHGKQPEKDVSTIVQYAPHLLPFQTESVRFSAETATQQLYLDRGYPSFFFIRMEWDQDTTKDEGVVPRATIHSIQFRLFNQENPYVSKLTESELYYLSHRNCHKYCGFQELWENENAVLLSLEDIGLITEKLGYPHRKRLELEIRVTWKTNRALERFRDLIEIKAEDLAARTLRLRTVCVYENGEFIGDIRRSEFVEKYI